MGLLQQSIEKKLSAVLGTAVTFEKLNFSVFGGSAEAHGVVVAGSDPSVAFLTIRRVRAEISLGAALKKEFVVKSLTVEKPVITITRRADGRTNVPLRPAAPTAPADPSANPRLTSAIPSATASDTSIDAGASDATTGNWKLEARKVLLVDGEVHYRDSTGYRASLERVLGETKEAGTGFDITLLAESAGRRDQAVELGPIRWNGHAENVANLSQWQSARVHGAVEVGDMLHARVDVLTINPLDAKAEINASLDLTLLSKLLPPDAPARKVLYVTNPRGKIQVTGQATYSAEKGIVLPDLIARAVDVAIECPGLKPNP